jgi:hypothetical protein
VLNPCGYADFELGYSLNHTGQPQAAIPYLQARLAYGGDNLDVVRRELADAQAKAGSAGSASPPADGNGHGKAKGHAKD